MKKTVSILFFAALALISPREGECRGNPFTMVKRFPAPEARQGVAADSLFFYAVGSREIAKYDKQTGQLVSKWQGTENGPIIHLDSGVVIDGKLVCAHSNYPGIPMTSSIEIWDTETLQHIGSHSFGIFRGSCTWLDWHDGFWWAAFAHYEKWKKETGKGTEWTTLVKFGTDWNEHESYIFPPSVIDRFRPMSNSGGSWGPDGYLYCTGHDNPEVYVLQLPDSGSVLELVEIVPIDNSGQGIAWDKSRPGFLYGIHKSNRQVIEFKSSKPLSQNKTVNSFQITDYLSNRFASKASKTPDPTKRSLLIHLSDLHCGLAEQDSNYARLIHHIIECYGDQAHKSVIFITGDLIDIAIKMTKTDTLDYYRQYLREIAEDLQSLEKMGFHILVIPGNHDLKIKDQTYRGFYENPNQNYLFLDLKREFHHIFYRNTSGESDYPVVDMIDGIAYIGVDVMDAAPDSSDEVFTARRYRRYYGKKGINFGISSRQLKKLSDLLDWLESKESECRGIVFYLHHIEAPERNADFQRFFDQIERLQRIPVLALLAGHTHVSLLPHEHWNQRFPTFIAGTATNKCKKPGCDSFHIRITLPDSGRIADYSRCRF
ncbi:metallophosphoesterase [candidate division KSB1 bacterium]|nr:metallophosphoesterase [candidate division KSB1 bacterium]